MNEIRSPEYRLLAGLLRTYRTEAGQRQIDVAEALGVPQSSISKLEVGERRLDLPELRRVCGVLGVSLSEFVQRFEREMMAENAPDP